MALSRGLVSYGRLLRDSSAGTGLLLVVPIAFVLAAVLVAWRLSKLIRRLRQEIAEGGTRPRRIEFGVGKDDEEE